MASLLARALVSAALLATASSAALLPADNIAHAHLSPREEQKSGISNTVKWVLIAIGAVVGITVLSILIRFLRNWGSGRGGGSGERMSAGTAMKTAIRDHNRPNPNAYQHSTHQSYGYDDHQHQQQQFQMWHQQQEWDRQQQQQNEWHQQNYGR